MICISTHQQNSYLLHTLVLTDWLDVVIEKSRQSSSDLSKTGKPSVLHRDLTTHPDMESLAIRDRCKQLKNMPHFSSCSFSFFLFKQINWYFWVWWEWMGLLRRDFQVTDFLGPHRPTLWLRSLNTEVKYAIQKSHTVSWLQNQKIENKTAAWHHLHWLLFCVSSKHRKMQDLCHPSYLPWHIYMDDGTASSYRSNPQPIAWKQ